MRGYRHELYIKILLVLVSEAAAVIAIDLLTKHVITVPYTPTSSIVIGAILAVVVVLLYDKRLERKRAKIEEELRELSDAAFMRHREKQLEEDLENRK